VVAALAGGGGAEEFRQRLVRALQFILRAAVQEFADHQPFRRDGGLVAQQFGQGGAQRQGHLLEYQHRDVANARFEVGEVALGDAGFLGQHAAGDAAPGAQEAHALAKAGQERVFVRAVWIH